MRKKFFLFLPILIPLSVANGAMYQMPDSGNDIIGHNEIIHIKAYDTIDKLAQEYEVSYHELLEANPGINPKKLSIGTPLLIPLQFILPQYRQGIVINIPELRLYYFIPNGKYVFTTPVGLGRSSWRTPTMTTKIIKKEMYPAWHAPKSIIEYAAKNGHQIPEEIPSGDPENPLGKYALHLGGEAYLIHGNNDQSSVGKYYSSGCIRLYNKAIETLYPLIAVGTIVHITHQDNKIGWLDGKLYLESHLAVNSNESNQDVQTQIQKVIYQHSINIDWNQVNLITEEKLGIPEIISKE
jgi:L,D-transpeptidase ErfK/SrfK